MNRAAFRKIPKKLIKETKQLETDRRATCMEGKVDKAHFVTSDELVPCF